VKTTIRYSDYKRFHANVTIHYDGEVLDDAKTPAPGKEEDPNPMGTVPK
jgi:hypothetical protein